MVERLSSFEAELPETAFPSGAWERGTVVDQFPKGFYAEKARAASGLLALAVGFTIPLQTTPAEVLLGVFVGYWLLSLEFRLKWDVIRRNKVACLSLALFAALAAGIAYSSVSWREAATYLLKYRELLYVPLFVTVFQDARLRTKGIQAFVLGAVVLLGLSYLEFLTGIDIGLQSSINQGAEASAGYVVFKDRIVHNLLMSFLAYWLAHELVRSPRQWWLYGTGLVLTVANLVFLVQGRTGYLVLGALTVLFMCQQFKLRGVVYASALLLVTGGLCYSFSSVIRARFDATVTQLQNHFGAERKRSPDPRLEFYENTLQLVRQHPLVGTGTGSFAKEYAALTAGREAAPTVDPHCEYLLISVQLGLPGLGLFLYLLCSQWRSASRLAAGESRAAQGMLVTIAAGSLFNSLILGFTGGLFYAYFSGLLFAGLTDELLSVSATLLADCDSSLLNSCSSVKSVRSV